MLKKQMRLVLVTIFFVLLYMPLADSILKLDTTAPLKENRNLQKFPVLKLDTKSLIAFPDTFEKWANDNFGFRHLLIKMHAVFRLKALGLSPNEDLVVIGDDGWMYYTSSLRQELAGGRPFDDEYLKKIKKYFEWMQIRLKKLGVEYIIVVAPDKKDIYPEFVPLKYHPSGGGPWRTEALVAYLKENSTVPVIDLASYLKNQKSKGMLYFKTDAHWNNLGAFLASEYIAEQLNFLVPGMNAPKTVDDCVVIPKPMRGGDLARLLGIEEYVNEENSVKVELRSGFGSKRIVDGNIIPPRYSTPDKENWVYEHENKSLPVAVVYKDSFGKALSPYLSEHFSRVVYYGQHPVQMDTIRHEKPDVVIHEIVGRNFIRFVNIKEVANASKNDR